MQVSVIQAELARPANYFLVVQFEQVDGGLKVSQEKHVTDVVPNSQRPYFLQNVAQFKVDTLAYDFKLKVGLFETTLEDASNRELLLVPC
jgi:hypothetical protein